MVLFELNIGKRGSRIKVFGIVEPILKSADFSALSNFELRELVIDPFKDSGELLNSLEGLEKASGENSWILKMGLVSKLKPFFEELGLLPI